MLFHLVYIAAEDFEAFETGKKKSKKNKFKPEATTNGDSPQPPPGKLMDNALTTTRFAQRFHFSLHAEKRAKFDLDKLKSALYGSSSQLNRLASQEDMKQSKPSVVDAAKAKLKASGFRYLNELLYTQEGKESLKMFQEDPDAFHTYHAGYADQVLLDSVATIKSISCAWSRLVF